MSISDADRAPELDYVATVHHGIDLDALPFSATGGDALVAFGRIHPDKGTAEAIEIARRAGRRLIICGIVQDARYFDEHVEPHIDGDRVSYLGSVGPDRRAEVLGAAVALLHPIAFDEPFGLSVVEAMACGTPVIAYPRGSMPEVVDDGVTGFLVDGVEAAAAAVDAGGGARPRGDPAGGRAPVRRRADGRRLPGCVPALDRNRDDAREPGCPGPFRARLQLLAAGKRDVHVARAGSGRGARRLRAHARSRVSASSGSFCSPRTFCPAPMTVPQGQGLPRWSRWRASARDEKLLVIPTLITINMSGKILVAGLDARSPRRSEEPLRRPGVASFAGAARGHLRACAGGRRVDPGFRSEQRDRRRATPPEPRRGLAVGGAAGRMRFGARRPAYRFSSGRICRRSWPTRTCASTISPASSMKTACTRTRSIATSRKASSIPSWSRSRAR